MVRGILVPRGRRGGQDVDSNPENGGEVILMVEKRRFGFDFKASLGGTVWSMAFCEPAHVLGCLGRAKRKKGLLHCARDSLEGKAINLCLHRAAQFEPWSDALGL